MVFFFLRYIIECWNLCRETSWERYIFLTFSITVSTSFESGELHQNCTFGCFNLLPVIFSLLLYSVPIHLINIEVSISEFFSQELLPGKKKTNPTNNGQIRLDFHLHFAFLYSLSSAQRTKKIAAVNQVQFLLMSLPNYTANMQYITGWEKKKHVVSVFLLEYFSGILSIA